MLSFLYFDYTPHVFETRASFSNLQAFSLSPTGMSVTRRFVMKSLEYPFYCEN